MPVWKQDPLEPCGLHTINSGFASPIRKCVNNWIEKYKYESH